MNIIKAARLYRAVRPFLEYLEKNDMRSLLKNWKTTLAGLITAVAAVGPLLHILTPEQAGSIFGAAVSFGLIAAKDGNVTGGTK